MRKVLFTLLIFLILSSIAFAQSFKDKVIFSPDIAFLWNFQRGFEEFFRFTKFTPTMRIDYSLELSERRIGEIEVLLNKNNTILVPRVENDYEIELSKIEVEINSTSIIGMLSVSPDIKTNVTQRLQYHIKVLNEISKKVPEEVKVNIDNAVKKASDCISKIG
jgi:hypothetical protein